MKDQDRRDHLGQNCRQRHSCHSHGKDDHEQKIQDHIDDACQRQKIERSSGIPYRTQDRAAEIVCHLKRHPRKIDPHIQCGMSDHILRCPHHGKCRFGGKKADEDKRNTTDQSRQNRSLNRFSQIFLLICPIISGHKYIGAHR